MTSVLVLIIATEKKQKIVLTFTKTAVTIVTIAETAVKKNGMMARQDSCDGIHECDRFPLSLCAFVGLVSGPLPRNLYTSRLGALLEDPVLTINIYDICSAEYNITNVPLL